MLALETNVRNSHPSYVDGCNLFRKNGSNPREILKSFVEKLVGRRPMGMSNERNDGLERRNSFTMSKKHLKDICH